MHGGYVFATLMILAGATSAQAQHHEFEHFHGHFRGYERSLPPTVSLPASRYGGAEEHASLHHRPVEAAKGDGPTCDNTGLDPDAVIAACGRIIAHGQIKGGYSLVVAYTHRGQAYENKADFGNAIADFSEAIRRKPDVAGYFALRGVASEKSGNVEVAQADFHQAVRLDPNNQDALSGLKRIETRSASAVVPATPPPPAAFVAPTSSAAVPTATPIVPATTPAAIPPMLPAAVPLTTTAAVPPPSSGTTAASPERPTATTTISGPAAGFVKGARVALVMGNGKYVNANVLPNPPNDAHAMAGALREIGFDVVEGENLDRANMETLLREFLHKASNASIVLLFYAGHGMQVDGKNYLVPVDAKLAEASDLPFETIEIDKLLDSLGDPGHTNIILLDACRDNPLARSFASHLPASRSAAVATGLAAYSAVGTGTLIAYATAPGQTALDGQGADSPFTTSLLKNIRTPGLEIRQVLTRVRAEVAAETGNKQIPWDNSSLMGDVVLVKQGP